MKDETPIPTDTHQSRADRRRRRPHYLRIPDTYGFEKKSNHPFSGMLIASTVKKWLPALRRSIRSRYDRHVGAKQLAKQG